MIKTLQRKLPIMMTLCLICTLFSFTTIFANEITPYYNNTYTASLSTSVNDEGLLTINYKYVGYSDTRTKAIITSYIEKQFLGIFWLRVDIGTTDDEWIQTINNYKYTGSRTFSLPSTGTYRTTVIYEIYGTGGSADEIKCQDTVTY